MGSGLFAMDAACGSVGRSSLLTDGGGGGDGPEAGITVLIAGTGASTAAGAREPCTTAESMPLSETYFQLAAAGWGS